MCDEQRRIEERELEKIQLLREISNACKQMNEDRNLNRFERDKLISRRVRFTSNEKWLMGALIMSTIVSLLAIVITFAKS
ncbi:hypothetical protein [Vibrio sp.]|uniref:hypothetical protein n=1 Tax=Vibrio sp. TaxID=678 RepID=UPI0037925D50